MTTQTKLSCHSYADLLCAPSVLLGFHPEESVVVIAVEDGHVRFCVRADVDWFDTAFTSTLESLLTALSRVPDARILLLGYSADPGCAAVSVRQFEDIIGSAVQEMLITDGSHYWNLYQHDPDTHPGDPWRYDQSSLAASAVYHGLQIHQDRESAVAFAREPRITPTLRAHLDEARKQLSESPDPMPTVHRLITSQDPLSDADAALLAVILEDDVCCAEVLAQMKQQTAELFQQRLIEARQAIFGQAAVNTLGLLGVSSWLAGGSAMLVECIEQLMQLAPDGTLTRFLDQIQSQGIPPELWSDDTCESDVPLE